MAVRFVQNHLTAGESDAVSWIAVQSPDRSTQRAGLRHMPSTVLLRLQDGAAWLLSTFDAHPWDTCKVNQAAEFLIKVGDSWPWERLAVRLSDDLEMPKISVENIPLDSGAETLFKLIKVTDSITRQWLQHNPDVSCLSRIVDDRQSLHRELVARVEVALGQFLAQLDAESVALLSPRGMLPSEYNYLARGRPHRLYRMQFAQNFPLLLGAVVGQDPDKRWSAFRSEIDLGQSPISSISKQFHVSPSTVRCLRRVSPSEAGPEWESKPHKLLTALDAVAPEHRPRNAQQWQLLSRQYKQCTDLFNGSPAHAALVGARLRHAMRITARQGLQFPEADTNDIELIERFRDAFKQIVLNHFQLDRSRTAVGMERRGAIAIGIDRYLGRLAWPRLTELARKFSQELSFAVVRHRDLIDFIDSQRYWCFIPDGEFIAPNGMVVICLEDIAALRKHGQTIDNCLAGGHRAQYHEACASGRSMIVAVLAQESRRTLSTAEFRLQTAIATTSSGHNLRVALKLVQHTGRGNTSPGFAETQAISALVSVFESSIWQAHAIKGIRAIAQRGLVAASAGTTKPMLFASREAFQRTFGESRTVQVFQEVASGEAHGLPNRIELK